MARQISRYRLLRWFLLFLLFSPATVYSQQARQKGDASLTLEYQYISTGDFEGTLGRIEIEQLDTHVLLLSGEYALNERWTVMASVPYIQRRYIGENPHDAVNEFSNYEPPDLVFIDDGSYQKGLQDAYVGVQYLAKDDALSVSPYMYYGRPVNNYHIYGWSALGRGIWHLPVGVRLGYTPYFSDWNFNADIAYVFTEKTLGIDISHWLVHASIGYYFTPRIAANLFLSVKKSYSGKDIDQAFIDEFLDTETFYLHDRVLKHSYFNAGIGFDWSLSDKYELFGNMFTMLNIDQTNDIEFAVSIGFTRYFSFGD